MPRARWRALAALAVAATVGLGLVGTYSYGLAYWQHRGFAPVARLPQARIGRLLTVHFYSPALRRRADYLVYLPPGYSPRRRYPVYYLLHGAPGGPQDFISVVNLDVRLSNRLSEHQLRPMILVMPDGRVNGDTFSDSEWANTRAGAYESFVLDVVRDVDRRFAAIPARWARVIAGYSAGGYGALNIALHHPQVFANVQSWSGYFVQSRRFSPVFAHASRAYIAYNSPLEYARRLSRRLLARYPLRVYMFTGRSDPDGRGIGRMAAELRRAGAVASYNLFPGGHDWQVWYAQVDRMMEMASQMVSHPLPVRGPLMPAAPRRLPAGRALPGRRPGLAPAGRRLARPGARAPASGTPGVPGPASAASARAHHRSGLGPVAWLGLLLAVASAALINLGFLLQQRGLLGGEPSGGLRGWLAALRSRTWLAGQALGWAGFALQILAVALAPLSLVQAFAAGGLALSVPLAAGIFGQRVPRLQAVAVTVVAGGLALLSLGVPRPGGGMSAAALICATALALMAAAAIASHGGASARAVAAGLLYGVADAAIKAVSVLTHAHGAAALLSGWTLLAAAATFGGFLAFQAALRLGSAVSAISLMTVLTTLTALGFGLLAFRESLGSGPATTLLHLGGLALVLACVPALSDAELRLPAGRLAALRAGRRALAGGLRAVGAGLGAVLAALLAVLTGTGLLYGLRGLGWLAAGPRLGDALPLLQLAGFDGQPLLRVACAWVAAGLVLGTLLIRIRPAARLVIAGGLALVLLLFASEASYALARNLRLSAVLAGRLPGEGAWIEAVLLTLAAALPRPLTARRRLPGAVFEPVLRARHLLGDRAG